MQFRMDNYHRLEQGCCWRNFIILQKFLSRLSPLPLPVWSNSRGRVSRVVHVDGGRGEEVVGHGGVGEEEGCYGS